MSQNGQTRFKNLAANAARFLECVWPICDIMHWRVKRVSGRLKSFYHWIELLVILYNQIVYQNQNLCKNTFNSKEVICFFNYAELVTLYFVDTNPCQYIYIWLKKLDCGLEIFLRFFILRLKLTWKIKTKCGHFHEMTYLEGNKKRCQLHKALGFWYYFRVVNAVVMVMLGGTGAGQLIGHHHLQRGDHWARWSCNFSQGVCNKLTKKVRTLNILPWC